MPGHGQLVTETLDYDGGRPVTVYMPAGEPEAIVYCSDGQLITRWGEDLQTGGAPSTMIVGAHRLDDEMARIHEYSPRFDPDRFAAHEKFFTEDIPGWVGERFGVKLPPSRTAVGGVSAGGELALAMGVRHPDSYAAILCASPGAGYQPPEGLSRLTPRTYLVAGTREPFFLENATRWADALQAAGVEVVMAERDGTHGDPFWREEFPRMVAWAFRSRSGDA